VCVLSAAVIVPLLYSPDGGGSDTHSPPHPVGNQYEYRGMGMGRGEQRGRRERSGVGKASDGVAIHPLFPSLALGWAVVQECRREGK